MGNLFRLLQRPTPEPETPDIFLDFENAVPTAEEIAVYNRVAPILEKTPYMLRILENYVGSIDIIRTAIANPNDEEALDVAWNAVLPKVALLQELHNYAHDIQTVLPELLSGLRYGKEDAVRCLETKQALARQWAHILQLTLKLDELKMLNPAIQNDFSYFKRTLGRKRSQEPEEVVASLLTLEAANKMSMFLAHATPFLHGVCEVTGNFIRQNGGWPDDSSADSLVLLAKLCREMIENPLINCRFKNDETRLFCVRVMVAVIVLYDSVHPVGAFSRTSPLDMKAYIRVVKDLPGGKSEPLLNALRFTTKHLNDDSTPKQIKSLLQ